MDGRNWIVILIELLVASAVITIIVRATRRWRLEAAAHDAMVADRNAKAIDAGEMTKDGKWLCAVCKPKALATRPWPRVGVHLLDKVPLLNKLYSLTPRYTVEADGDEKALCQAHFRMVTRKLEQKLSQVRARAAEFNSGIEEELARLESGQLLEWAKAEYEMAAALRDPYRGPQMLLLPPQAPGSTETPLPGAVGTVTVTPSQEEEG